MPPIIDKQKCTHCGTCAQICPLDVIRMQNQKPVIKYPYECWHCRACVKECRVNAIRIRYPLSHMMYTMDVKGEKE